MIVRTPAARAKQGELTLFSTALTVRDLVKPGFFSVDTLDPQAEGAKGYQRLLNAARAKKLADYIVGGQEQRDAFLPTSVFLATDKSLPYDEAAHELLIDSSEIGPLSVVDGQHRLEGLRLAAERDSRVLDFEVPVTIAVSLSHLAQTCHFLIVNTTQKSVDKSVEQRIIARLTEAIDLEELPTLPRWILRTVEKGEVEKAIRYVDYLNTAHGSPWIGKIAMANTGKNGATVNQKTFVTAIVRYVLTASNPLEVALRDFDREKKAFLNYWAAIAELLDDGNSDTLFKYNGIELFCRFSTPFFVKLHERGSFTQPVMVEVLRSCFDNVEGEYAGVGHPEWWATGGRAGQMNAAAINLVAQELTRALHRGSGGGAIAV